MLSDLRFVIRALARQRVFTVITICTLALGIGGGVAIFSVADWVLFRMNQFPSDVYLIGGRTANQPLAPTRMDFMVRAYEGEHTALRTFAKASASEGNVVVDGQPVTTSWMGVTPNLLPLLGVVPWRGRDFVPGEDKEGSDQVAIVSHQFWKKHLGGREDALGREIALGAGRCTVIGILRQGQAFPAYLHADVYRPLTYRIDPAQPWAPFFFCLAQLAPGATREQAEAALRGAKLDVPPSMAPYVRGDQPVLASIAELNQVFRPGAYWMMLGAGGFLYAIACLNAANLMLVRMLGMRRELAIRLALGGGTGRIVRLLVLECAVLAVAAAPVGAGLANWFFPLLLSAAGNASFAAENWWEWQLNGRALGAMAGLTLAASLLLALLPAWRVLRAEIHTGLKDGGGALGEGRGLARLRGGLVVLQAACAAILLAGAGLMIRTFENFQKIDLGFQAEGLVKIQLALPPTYPRGGDGNARLEKLRAIQAQLEKLPGVRAVGFADDVLLPGWYYPYLELSGPDARPLKAPMHCLSRGYESAAGMRLKRGHWLRESRGNEVLVSEALARAMWPDVDDPTGQTLAAKNANLGTTSKGWLVAGVVADVRSMLRETPGPVIYGPEGWGADSANVFIVRLDQPFTPVWADALRRGLYAWDSQLVAHYVMPISRLRDAQLHAENMANSVLKVLALLALLLTVVGVFSVLAYTVDRRMGEFGVRLAFGATPRDLVALVLRRGMALTVIGVALGVGGAMALQRTLQTLLFGVEGYDGWVLGGVAVLLVATAVAACVWPARRAARVDVTQLMRSE